MPAPDVFVEKKERRLLEAMVEDMIRNDHLEDGWRVPDDD